MRGAFALIVIVALVAGCGGGDDAREEFVKQADANCEQRQQAELALEQRSEEETAADPRAWVRITEREMAKQEKLEPPDELAEDWRRYLQLFRTGAEGFAKLSELDDGLDFNERSVLERDARRAAVQARQVAKRMGLKVCAEAFY